MGCDLEKRITETLLENEVEEISSFVGYSNTEKTSPVKMGYVAVSQHSTALADWDNCDHQSSLFELQNR